MNPFGNLIQLPIKYSEADSTYRRVARQEYIRIQDGKCCHCQYPLAGPPSPEMAGKKIDLSLFPPGFMGNPIHLHHDHETDLTIGAVHAQCNAVLWQYHGQ